MALYRSEDGIHFDTVFDNGLTNPDHQAIFKLKVFKDKLYVSTMNMTDGFSVFSSEDGLNFSEVLSAGGKEEFKTNKNTHGWQMAVYNIL